MIFPKSIPADSDDLLRVRLNLIGSEYFHSVKTACKEHHDFEDIVRNMQPNGGFGNSPSTSRDLTIVLYEMTCEFKNPLSIYFNQEKLKCKIYLSLRYWLANVPEFRWTISAMEQPTKLGMILLMLYDDQENDLLNSDLCSIVVEIRNRSREFMRYSWSNGFSKSEFVPGFGSIVSDDWRRMGNIGYRLFGLLSIAVCCKSSDDISIIRIMVSNQFPLQINTRLSPVAAALFDGSIHQHGSQIYNIGYGSDWLVMLAHYSGWVFGTKWKFTKQQFAAWGDMVLNGMKWMFFKGHAPHNIMGRHNALLGGVHGSVTPFLKDYLTYSCNTLSQFKRSANLLSKFEVDPSHYQIQQSKYFWNSNVILHHSFKYFASIKMLSDRVIGTESSDENSWQGIMNYHIADGSTFIYRRGNEYDLSRVVWNWRAIPGITCSQKAGTLPLVPWGNNYYSKNTLAGGVCDGRTAIATFYLDRVDRYHKTKALKAYFTFNDILVCVGNSIRSFESDSVEVHTCINQCDRVTEICFAINGVEGQSVSLFDAGHFSWDISAPSWFWHDHVGYIVVPKDGSILNVFLDAEIRTGVWSKLDKRNPSDPCLANIFHLGINHGHSDNLTNDSYFYMMIPGIEKHKLARKFKTEILSKNKSLRLDINSPDIISLSYKAYTGLFFFGDNGGTARNLGSDATDITSDSPVVLLLKRSKNGLKINVSRIRTNFDGKSKVELKINRSLVDFSCRLRYSAKPYTVQGQGACSVIRFDLSKSKTIYEGYPTKMNVKFVDAKICF